MNNSFRLSFSIALLSLLSTNDALAENQELYLSAGISSHELESFEGNKLSALFGARDHYSSGWFLGGEVEVSYLDYEVKAIGESYSLGANIPLGKRFELTESMAVDIYGLAGYSMTNLNLTKKKKFHGLKWGVGSDISFSDFMIGARLTNAELGNDDYQDKLREKNVTLLASYKF